MTLSHTIFHTQLCHTLSFTQNFHPHRLSPHHPSHTTLSHTIFHNTIFHTPSFTHNLSPHHLSHTTLSHPTFHHTIFRTQLCHTPSFATPSFTHNFVTHHLSHTTLSHMDWFLSTGKAPNWRTKSAKTSTHDVLGIDLWSNDSRRLWGKIANNTGCAGTKPRWSSSQNCRV